MKNCFFAAPPLNFAQFCPEFYQMIFGPSRTEMTEQSFDIHYRFRDIRLQSLPSLCLLPYAS